ncbi:unnamed protein product, partial [Closterium sp. Naga37s-1]
VDLVSVVHIADQDYYDALQAELATYDRVLYEMVADKQRASAAAASARPAGGDADGEDAQRRDSRWRRFVGRKESDRWMPPKRNPKRRRRGVVGAIQSLMARMLRLSFQLDHVDYRRSNFYHADLDLATFLQLQEERGESMLSFAREVALRSTKAIVRATAARPLAPNLGPLRRMLLWAARFVPMPLVGLLVIEGVCAPEGPGSSALVKGAEFQALLNLDLSSALKVVLARQITLDTLDGAAGVMASSVIIGERNRACMEEVHEALKAGSRRIAVFYGSGHLPDMHLRLTTELGLEPSDLSWRTAWSIPTPAFAPLPAPPLPSTSAVPPSDVDSVSAAATAASAAAAASSSAAAASPLGLPALPRPASLPRPGLGAVRPWWGVIGDAGCRMCGSVGLPGCATVGWVLVLIPCVGTALGSGTVPGLITPPSHRAVASISLEAGTAPIASEAAPPHTNAPFPRVQPPCASVPPSVSARHLLPTTLAEPVSHLIPPLPFRRPRVAQGTGLAPPTAAVGERGAGYGGVASRAGGGAGITGGAVARGEGATGIRWVRSEESPDVCHGLRFCVLLDYCCPSSHDLVALLSHLNQHAEPCPHFPLLVPLSSLPFCLLPLPLTIPALLQELSPLLSDSCHAFPNHQHHQHCSHHHPPQQSSPLPHPPSPFSTSAVPPTASPPPAFPPAPNPSSPYTPHAPPHPFPLCDAAVAAAAGDVGVVEMGGACYLVRVSALHSLAAQAEGGTHTGALGARPLSPLPVPLSTVYDGTAPSVSACTALDGLLPVLSRMPPLLLACRNASLQEVPPTDAQATLTHLLSFVLNLLSPPIALATTTTRPSHPPPMQQQQQEGALGTEGAAAETTEGSRGGHERVGESGGEVRAEDDGFVRVSKPRRKARRWQQEQQQQQQEVRERLHGDNGCRSGTGGGGEDGEGRGSDCGVGRATGSGRGAVVVMQGDAALRACHVALPTVNGWLLGYPVVYLLPALPPLHASPQPFPSEQPAVPPGEAMGRCLAATPLSVLSVSAACSAGEKGSEGSRPHDSQQHGSLRPTNTHTHELLRFSVPSFLLSAPDSPSPHLHYPWLHSLLTALQSRTASCPRARYGAPNEAVESEDGRRDSGGSGGSSTLGVLNVSVGGGAAACSVQEERETTCCCTGAIMCQAWHERQQQALTGERHSIAWWCWEQLRVAVSPAETLAVVL